MELRTGSDPIDELIRISRSLEGDWDKAAAAAQALLDDDSGDSWEPGQSPWANWQQLCGRLLALERGCPGVLCTPEVVGGLLKRCCPPKGRKLDVFFPFWEGKTLNLSWGGSDVLYRLVLPYMVELLERLSAQSTLVIDRDAVPPGMPGELIRILLKHVSLLPPAVNRGVSGLTRAILNSGDIRLIRRAVQTGVIPPEESTADILRYQGEQPAFRIPQEARLVLLSVPRTMGSLSGEKRNHWYSPEDRLTEEVHMNHTEGGEL